MVSIGYVCIGGWVLSSDDDDDDTKPELHKRDRIAVATLLTFATNEGKHC